MCQLVSHSFPFVFIWLIWPNCPVSSMFTREFIPTQHGVRADLHGDSWLWPLLLGSKKSLQDFEQFWKNHFSAPLVANNMTSSNSFFDPSGRLTPSEDVLLSESDVMKRGMMALQNNPTGKQLFMKTWLGEGRKTFVWKAAKQNIKTTKHSFISKYYHMD